MSETLQQLIQRGITFLDNFDPFWRRKIDLEIFDIGNPAFCLIGQLGTGYSFLEKSESMGLTEAEACRCGFDINENFGTPSNTTYRILTAAWVEVITEELAGVWNG